MVYYRDLIRELVARDIRLRYKRSLLGLGWSLLNPLLQLVVFYIVFTRILPVSTPNYAVFLFTGILAWNWFSSSLTLGCAAITDNVALIRQPGFPAAILPVITVAANLVNFFLALPILIAACLITARAFPGSGLVALPLVIVAQFTLTLSLVYVLAAVHVSFRDTQYLLGIVLLFAFYLSPVFYSAAAVPLRYQNMYRLNPVVHILEGYRTIFIQGVCPEMRDLIAVLLGSIVVLCISFSVFSRASRWFVEEIGS